MEDIKNFLKETEYCDFSHPEIQKIAKEFLARYPDKKELAVTLFYWVRDNIFYRVGLWQRKASETLKEREGTCTNKANLLVALLRAGGIPAGYGLMSVKGQEYLGPAGNLFARKIASQSVHFYTYVYLDGRWIKCDASDDRKFSCNTSYFNPQSRLVEWDGETDAKLNLNSEHILSDIGPLADVDDKISKKPKNAKGIILRLGNLYIKFLRENEKRVFDIKELKPLFKSWLRKNHFVYYCFFCLIHKEK